MNKEIKEYDVVTLANDIPGAKKGDRGTIVYIYSNGAYEIEIKNNTFTIVVADIT